MCRMALAAVICQLAQASAADLIPTSEWVSFHGTVSHVPGDQPTTHEGNNPEGKL